MADEPVFSVSDFVATLNQTLEFAYPSVLIVGELANFRVSKNRWVYFDLKDELASVRFFGTVYNLPGPLEDGMLLRVRGYPRLHPLYNFSVTVQTMQPVGEGSIRRAADLLQAKLATEGLFDPLRKRPLPLPPQTIGLITSSESAAYHDFTKILNERWSGLDIQLFDVQVQGELAPVQIVEAIEYFNQRAQPPEVLVITRGGGSAEDLQAFSTELVTRAVAASRIPTLVAIGHEVDLSLAELAADQRASTPSNAAQLLVPDKRQELGRLTTNRDYLGQLLSGVVGQAQAELRHQSQQLAHAMQNYLQRERQALAGQTALLSALNPKAVLARGYAIVRAAGKVVRNGGKTLKTGQTITIELSRAQLETTINKIVK